MQVNAFRAALPTVRAQGPWHLIWSSCCEVTLPVAQQLWLFGRATWWLPVFLFLLLCSWLLPTLTLGNWKMLTASHLLPPHRKWFFIPLCQWSRFLAQRLHTSWLLGLCLYLDYLVWINFVLVHPVFVFETSVMENNVGLLCFRDSRDFWAQCT